MLFVIWSQDVFSVLPGKGHGKPTDFWVQCSALTLSEMLKTWWFAGAVPWLWPPAAHSSRGPAVHYNRAMITPTPLARFSVPPRPSALRFQPSRHVIVPAPLTLSLPAAHNPCPSITASHMWRLVTLPLALIWPMWGNVLQMRRKWSKLIKWEVRAETDVNYKSFQSWQGKMSLIFD